MYSFYINNLNVAVSLSRRKITNADVSPYKLHRMDTDSQLVCKFTIKRKIMQ